MLYKLFNDLKSVFLVYKDRNSIAKIHALLVKSGFFGNGSCGSQLISAYARIDDIKAAVKVFDVLPHRGIDSWNAIIIAFSRKGWSGEVINFYGKMELEGVKPDSSTFTIALKACTSLLDFEMGENVRTRAVECGYENDVFVGSSVLNLHAKCGKMDDAMVVFEKMRRRDVVCWTAMITGFAQCGRMREAICMFRRMRNEGLEGDKVVMLGLIQACANIGDTRMGLSVHGYMIRRYFFMDVVVETSLVDMYAKNGRSELASCMFRRMGSRNIVTWSAMISGYAQNGFAVNALELLIEMQSFGFRPDIVSIVSALLACSQVGFLRLGKSIHGYIVRMLDNDQVLSTALIDMYSKCGLLSCARTLFDVINFRDSILWNTMITSYGMHGHGKEALSLFLEMTETNSKPDDTTFASLLSALGHSGLVDEGRYWFNIMVSKYNIQPSVKHYTVMVDLLARAGHVKEAYDLINSMTDESGIAIWVSLLSGCYNHGKLSVGELAAKKILELYPDEPGSYALVSNFFAASRRWNEVAGVRAVMKQTGTRKVPGCSAVEMDGILHSFVMEDKSHPQLKQIIEILGKLELEMLPAESNPEAEIYLYDFEKENASVVTL
ncbi:Pentatricopeptide repeat-containing protein [Heracleum sosnowskyi]|uniref:Pentatricopeptide repeat-containing protein n=1 Tax=Heracleum sosnowskyi TaxID=360622 RepID=A0AAD8M0E3_9APIA|nr:Pentatricopeptide repeat-containing protein [Heracleum sosnowskyi]